MKLHNSLHGVFGLVNQTISPTYDEPFVDKILSLRGLVNLGEGIVIDKTEEMDLFVVLFLLFL